LNHFDLKTIKKTQR